jgi:hypothetical protein
LDFLNKKNKLKAEMQSLKSVLEADIEKIMADQEKQEKEKGQTSQK